MSTLGAGTSVRFPHVVSVLVKSTVSSDEVYSSFVVGSAVDERARGVEVFDHIFGSVTKKHLGVMWGIVDPVFKVEFGDLPVNFILDVGVWDWAFESRVASCA